MSPALNRIGYYHLSVSELKSLGTGQPWDRIGYYGNRLPDFIAWTKSDEANAPIYEQIVAAMRELLPELDSIIVTQIQTQQQGIAMSFHGQRGYIAAPDLRGYPERGASMAVSPLKRIACGPSAAIRRKPLSPKGFGPSSRGFPDSL